jgi:lysophospholipase L1-like esterase
LTHVGDVTAEKRLILFLASALIANPVVIFLVTGSVLVALFALLSLVALFQLSYQRFGGRLPTVYLVNFAALASLFVHAELVFTTRFEDYAIDDLYQIQNGSYFNRPFLRKVLSDKEYSVEYLTNRDGFRIGYSQQVDKTYDVIDWLFIGDSYTQGAQVPFEDLYTTQLYRQFPHKIIANVGISGFGIADEYKWVLKNARRYRPEIVFLQLSSFNDFMKVYPGRVDFSDYLMSSSNFIRFLLQNIKYVNPAELPLGRWAEPFYPDEASNLKYNVFYKSSSKDKDADIEAFRRYLGLFQQAVTAMGARLVVILLPTKEQIRFRYLNEVVTNFRIAPDELDMERPNRLVRRLADSLGIDVVDVLRDFEAADVEPYFEFDEHLSSTGHALLASVLKAKLRTLGPEGHTRILSTDYAGDRYPSYMPDGRTILFQSKTGGSLELFLGDTSFTKQRRLNVDNVDK